MAAAASVSALPGWLIATLFAAVVGVAVLVAAGSVAW